MGDLVEGAVGAVESVVDTAASVVSKVMDNPEGLLLTAGIAWATGGLGAFGVEGAVADLALEQSIVAGWESSLVEAYAEGAASELIGSGVAANAGEMLQVAAANPAAYGATTMTDVSPGLLNAAADNAVAAGVPAGMPTAVADAGAISGMATNMAAPAAAAPGGIINNAMGAVLEFGKEYPGLALAGGQMATGIIGGIGQSGMLDRKIQADKEMQEQKMADAQSLEEWKRRFIQGGSSYDAKVPFQPTNQPLKRPDGSNVYATPGIVAGAMKG